MGKLQNRREAQGSITVFLSLLLLLILSLVMTMIEGARISTAKVFAGRAMYTAMDSVLAEYYSPLLEEYHLFALDASYGSNTIQSNELQKRLKDYMDSTFHPNQGIKNQEEGMELYDISIASLKMEEQTTLLDYQGELFINEAVEYMKYKEPGDALLAILDKMSLLEEPKKVSVLLEEQQKVQEELVAIDKGILALMRLLDGISTDGKGLKVNKEGQLDILPYFVKMICFGPVSMEQVAINSEMVFQVLKNSYINPLDGFRLIEEDFLRLNENLQKLEAVKATYQNTETSLTAAEEALSELMGMKEKSDEDKNRITLLVSEIGRLENEKKALKAEQDGYELILTELTNTIYSKQNEIINLMQYLRPLIGEAVAEIDQITETAKKAEPLIRDYEEKLSKEKNTINRDTYEGLEEGLKEIKKYSSDYDSGYDFPQMKEALVQDLELLTSTEVALSLAGQALLKEEYQESAGLCKKAEEILSAYRTKELRLDYSTLNLSKDTGMDPLGSLGSLFQDGILSLVMDTDLVSEAKLSETKLPSNMAALAGEAGENDDDTIDEINEETDDETVDMNSLFSGLSIGDKNNGIGGLFGSFGDYSPADMVGGAAKELAQLYLLQEYLQEHFYRLPMEGEYTGSRKPTALNYEQEYIVFGKSKDKENLEAMISSLLLIRVVLDFITILSDSALRNEARTIATAMVGFTGLPILVTITQILLMVILALGEALVDVCALLMGKGVPIYKKKAGLNYPELLLLASHTAIKEKANAYPENPKEISLSYSEYLRMFLLLKSQKDLAFRSMDLIQENIRIRYEDRFLLQNCLFGMRLKTTFHMKPKFTTISGIKEMLKSNGADIIYETELEYSY